MIFWHHFGKEPARLMKTRRVTVHPLFDQQAEAIFTYLKEESPSAARQFNQQLADTIAFVQAHPLAQPQE